MKPEIGDDHKKILTIKNDDQIMDPASMSVDQDGDNHSGQRWK